MRSPCRDAPRRMPARATSRVRAKLRGRYYMTYRRCRHAEFSHMSTLAVRVFRTGESTQEGRFETYDVPRLPAQTVLDVVTYIQRKLDSTLAYRFACRVGMCGSCA